LSCGVLLVGVARRRWATPGEHSFSGRNSNDRDSGRPACVVPADRCCTKPRNSGTFRTRKRNFKRNAVEERGSQQVIAGVPSPHRMLRRRAITIPSLPSATGRHAEDTKIEAGEVACGRCHRRVVRLIRVHSEASECIAKDAGQAMSRGASGREPTESPCFIAFFAGAVPDGKSGTARRGVAIGSSVGAAGSPSPVVPRSKSCNNKGRTR
jgi:hypothetical protein